uniref:sensor domain-containing protein n=1 Tax=Phytoactinopolyspora endophytica TaxID=1642495 RepID=UPI00197BA738
MNITYGSTDGYGQPATGSTGGAGADDPGYARQPRPDTKRPRAGWRQVGRDLAFLLPGLPIAIASFTALMVGFWLGVGTIVLAFLGFIILLVTLLTARGFAAAERGRVGIMEGRRVGPAYYRKPSGTGFSRVFGYLRDPQLWRDFSHGLL